jgi:hypothetical protein
MGICVMCDAVFPAEGCSGIDRYMGNCSDVHGRALEWQLAEVQRSNGKLAAVCRPSAGSVSGFWLLMNHEIKWSYSLLKSTFPEFKMPACESKNAPSSSRYVHANGRWNSSKWISPLVQPSKCKDGLRHST